MKGGTRIISTEWRLLRAEEENSSMALRKLKTALGSKKTKHPSAGRNQDVPSTRGNDESKEKRDGGEHLPHSIEGGKGVTSQALDGKVSFEASDLLFCRRGALTVRLPTEER